MNAGTRINSIVDSPIMAFTTIGERSSNFLEAGIQGEIVSDRVLPARWSGFKVWELGYRLLTEMPEIDNFTYSRFDGIVNIFQQQLLIRGPFYGVPSGHCWFSPLQLRVKAARTE